MHRSPARIRLILACVLLALIPLHGESYEPAVLPKLPPKEKRQSFVRTWTRPLEGGVRPNFSAPIYVTGGLLVVNDEAHETGDRIDGKLLLIAADTGQTLRTIPWTAPASLSDFEGQPVVVPLNNDRFLVKSWNALTLYSVTGEQLRARTLEIGSTPASYNPKLTLRDRWVVAASRNGSVILATKHAIRESAAEEHWLSSETLEDLAVEKADTRLCCLTVSTDQVAYSTANPKHQPVLIRSKGSQPKPLCDKCFGSKVLFLSDNEVLVLNEREASVLLVATSGEVRYRGKLSKERESGSLVGMASEPAEMVFLLSPRGFEESSCCSYHLVVLEMGNKKITNTMDLVIPPVRDKNWLSSESPRFGLSPDGKSVALLQGKSLTAYSLNP